MSARRAASMATVTDIGTRIELLPMDGHLCDITVALYRQATADGPAFLMHTYSKHDQASRRIDRIAEAMTVLGGLEPTTEARLRFPCGAEHNLAVRRAFLEACKRDPSEPLAALPMTTLDRKSGLTIDVDSLGDGQYRVRASGDDPESQAGRRIGVIVNGLLKLGAMRRVQDATGVTEDCVAFECGCAHDALLGLLLLRAPNVRAIVREQEAMAARGTLSAPSARAE